MTDREVLSNRAQIEALIAEREGMIAENAQREHRGEAMAYGEAHFGIIAYRFRAIASAPAEDKPCTVHAERIVDRDGNCHNCGKPLDKPKPAVTEEELAVAMNRELRDKTILHGLDCVGAANICARVALRVLGGGK